MLKRISTCLFIFVFLCLIQNNIQFLFSSSSGEEIKNIERSWEVRWFFEGEIPDEVESWFFKNINTQFCFLTLVH